MIKAIHHAAISTGNLDRLVAFYRDSMGFEVAQEFGWEKGSPVADAITGLSDSAAKVAMLQLEDFRLELFEFTSPTPEPGDTNRPVCDHGITHLCFLVQDINTEYERLNSSGMVFHCPPQSMGPNTLVTYGRDPDGNVIELMENSEG